MLGYEAQMLRNRGLFYQKKLYLTIPVHVLRLILDFAYLLYILNKTIVNTVPLEYIGFQNGPGFQITLIFTFGTPCIWQMVLL